MRDPAVVPRLSQEGGVWSGRFEAMASPCKVLIDTEDPVAAGALLQIAAREAARIERKWSRYRKSGVVHEVNSRAGERVHVDEETANLLDFGARLHALSEGCFDITSGVLRRVWTFDGGDRVPSSESVAEVLTHVGWRRVEWEPPWIRLRPGMEIDLGGIGKEYAVDRVHDLLAAETSASFLVDFGGDLRVSGPKASGASWRVGIERPGTEGTTSQILDVRRGGLATSGDARRFLLIGGIRYGHILDARSGWPPPEAPRSVTVLADTCTEAGCLSTLGILQGIDAERFLEEQGARAWTLR